MFKIYPHRSSLARFASSFSSAARALFFLDVSASLASFFWVTHESTTTSMPQQVGDNMTTTASYYYYRVKLGFTAPIWLCWGALVLARFYWNNYQVSSRVVLASYLLKVITPIFILFVPFRDYFDSEMSTSNVLIQVGILASLLQIAFQSLIQLFSSHTHRWQMPILCQWYTIPQSFRLFQSHLLLL